MVRDSDLHIAGTGLDLDVGRTFDGLFPTRATFPSWYGYVAPQGGGDLVVGLAGGGFEAFHNIPRKGYVAPAGYTADLFARAGQYELIDHKTGAKLVYGDRPGSVSSSAVYLSGSVDRNGNRITYNYASGPSAGPTSITDTQGRTVTIVVTSGTANDFNLTLGDGYRTITWHYAYGADGVIRVDSSTDASGWVTRFTYDGTGHLTQLTSPGQRVLRFTYNADSTVATVTRVTDASGATSTTRYAYGGGGSSPCAQAAPPGGQPTDPVGMYGCTTVTDANSAFTSYGVDAFHQVVKVVDGLANVTTTAFSAARQVVDLADAVSAAKTQFNYDATMADRPTGAALPTGATSALGYTAGSAHPYQLDTATDTQANCTAYTYTASANLATLTPGRPAGSCSAGGAGTVTNVYQNQGASCGASAHTGLLCQSTDGRGSPTYYTYDSAGNLRSVTPPAPLGAVSVTPDGLSRTFVTLDGKSQRTRYLYDPMDRVITVTYGGDDACTSLQTCTGFAYDHDGNLVGRSDVTGYTGFVYDPAGRLTEKWPTGLANTCAGYTGVHYTYDAVGNVASACDAGGTVSYGYDAANQVAFVAEPGGSCYPVPRGCPRFTYTHDHQRATTTYPGGVVQTFGYDASGRVSTVVTTGPHGPYPSFSYCYHLNDDCGAALTPPRPTRRCARRRWRAVCGPTTCATATTPPTASPGPSTWRSPPPGRTGPTPTTPTATAPSRGTPSNPPPTTTT
ncbi:MAG: hypothetical protein LC792_01070, partial [Actinobacteria bacterium]|nr:hypothetical protein [Actinomycetota bacterium]